jgi:cation diffusion facilitator family transporter
MTGPARTGGRALGAGARVSTRVVLAALAGNLAVALIKFSAFAMTRSTAMLTEAVHSLVDTADQLLLLVGQARGSRPPDESHPFGNGMEAYFWSFVVALMIFALGGTWSIWEGFTKVLAPQPISRPWVSLVVLGLSAIAEGTTFRIGYRAYRRIAEGRLVRGREIGLWGFLRISKDPSLYTTLLEDGAALTGLSLAALGVIGASWLHQPWADGAASVAIGLLLIAVATFMANETRSLIAGEAAAFPVVEEIRTALGGDPRITDIVQVATLQLGHRTFCWR